MELSRIKARLESLQELGELVGALRSMAASRARDAQEALTGTRNYRAVVERAIAEVLPLVRPDGQGGDLNGTQDRHLLVVTSENGFVGGFNTRIIDHALGLKETDETLVIIGQRGQAVAAEEGISGARSLSMTSRIQGVTPLARRIVRTLGQSASARIVFARQQKGAGFDVSSKRILPLGQVATDADRAPPVLHLPPARLMADLAREYLFAEVAHTLMESLASENTARLRAMDAASRNIDDKLEGLERDARIAWQEETTTDLLDVVTGAEAAGAG